ncbi:hypothetical protein [Ferrovibrio sp.]|uniref:hypothetical protein n=1 Tax=Ferrovibrio sp. TaxID=1917215 RepID=UPI0025C273ED|nr:hypothetical protein [Ferrovibrio sp.]MBX3454550.1 hypothetical protein [Ferrovibrio sp.]
MDDALPFADDPILVETARVWHRLCDGRQMPERTAFDPLLLSGAVWPYLLLAEPVPGSTAMRYRLVGGAHVDRYGYDFTGRTTAETAQGSYRQYLEEFYALTRQGHPVYAASQFRWDADGYAVSRRVCLPLACNRHGIQVLCAQTWISGVAWNGRSVPHLVGTGGFADGGYETIPRDRLAALCSLSP